MFLDKMFLIAISIGLTLILTDKLILKERVGKRTASIYLAYAFTPVLIVVFMFRSFAFEPWKIPSGSMYPAMKIGDYVVVNKFYYGIKLPVVKTQVTEGTAIRRGDIVIFDYPEDLNQVYTKRVIGLPGDEVGYDGFKLTINGEPLRYEYVGLYEGHESRFKNLKVYQEFISQDVSHQILIDESKTEARETFSVKVPEGKYFMLGDNRDYSLDSREWGMVDKSDLKGKVVKMLFNFGDRSRFMEDI